MIADMLTKGLPSVTFEKLQNEAGIVSAPAHLFLFISYTSEKECWNYADMHLLNVLIWTILYLVSLLLEHSL